MRQKVGDKKVRRLRKKTGLDVRWASVRGNTNHRVDLYLGDGSIVSKYKDGSLEKWEDWKWKPNPENQSEKDKKDG